MATDDQSDADRGQTGGDGPPSRPLIWTSDELLQGRSEAWIEHNNQMYRLRVTSLGNLILTK